MILLIIDGNYHRQKKEQNKSRETAYGVDTMNLKTCIIHIAQYEHMPFSGRPRDRRLIDDYHILGEAGKFLPSDGRH